MTGRITKIASLCMGLLLCLSAAASLAGTVELTRVDDRLSPYQHLQYFCSTASEAPLIDELRDNLDGWPWKSHGPHIPNHGYTSSICWYRLGLVNRTGRPSWTLGVEFPLITLVDTYLTTPEGNVLQHFREGGDLPYNLRETKTLALAFRLDLPRDEPREILMRLDTANLQLPLLLMESERFGEYQVIVTVMHSLFLGGMLVMILYNLLLYASLRESSWHPYVWWAAMITGLQVVLLGFGPRFLWPDHPHVSTLALEGILSGLLIIAPWFVNRFLNLSHWTPQLAVVLWGHAVIGAFLIPAIPLVDRISLMVVQLIALLSLSIIAITAVVLSYNRAPAEKPEVRGFILAWGCFVVGGITLILNKLGIIQRNLITEYLLELGSFLAVALLSRAVAAQINRLKQEKAKAEALSQAKSEFLATMSHEIRTPMNGVLGLADLLRHTPLNMQQGQYVETIYQSSQALLTVINDILDYSKIEAGRLTIEQMETSLEQLTGDCLVLHAPRVINKPVRLWCEMATDVPDSVLIDSLRLKQVLNNLLSNACKFTERGNVTLSITREDNRLRFDVHDSGIGLTEDEQLRIFHSYEQAAGSTSHRYGGTGLGLAISKRLVELMGGEIGVRSSSGHGACFWVTLPLVECPRQGEDRRLQSHTLGILTSDTHLADNLTHWAERWGMKVSSGHTIEEILRDPTPEILLLGPDHAEQPSQNLPRESQLLLTWPLAARPLGSGTPVVELPMHPAQLHHLLEMLLKAGDRPASEPASAIPSAFTGLNVLIAEDNAVNQMVLVSLLKSIGVTPEVVSNGEEALASVTSVTRQWDIIFMDTEMPLMDGHSATRKIRQWENATESPPSWIIAISAHATPDRVQEARNAGINDYLGKPVTRLQVIEALREALRQRKASA